MPSPIDRLFEEVFGFVPTRDGKAYEMLAAAVCKLISEASEVFHDQRVRGLFSKSLYQIDVLRNQDGESMMGEAKDYTISAKPVGRGDLQKLGGALQDLPVATGEFYSATGFTNPARMYGKAAEQIAGKGINLVNLRPSVEEDERGRIQKIVIRMHLVTPDYSRARFDPEITDAGMAIVAKAAERGVSLEGVKVAEIFDERGKVLTTIAELTEVLAGDFDRAHASFWLPNGHVRLEDTLVPIHGLTYDIPMNRLTEEVQITAEGRAVLLIRAEDGTVDSLITDRDLRRISFTEEGEAVLAQ